MIASSPGSDGEAGRAASRPGLARNPDFPPPFPKGGNPATADKLVVDMLNMMHGPLTEQFRQTLAAAR